MTSASEQAIPASNSSPTGEQPTLARNEVGLLGSTVFALAGAAPGQTVSIVLASLVTTAAYGTILPLAISALGLLCIAVAFHVPSNQGSRFQS
jgi:hypothetical protein